MQSAEFGPNNVAGKVQVDSPSTASKNTCTVLLKKILIVCLPIILGTAFTGIGLIPVVFVVIGTYGVVGLGVVGTVTGLCIAFCIKKAKNVKPQPRPPASGETLKKFAKIDLLPPGAATSDSLQLSPSSRPGTQKFGNEGQPNSDDCQAESVSPPEGRRTFLDSKRFAELQSSESAEDFLRRSTHFSPAVSEDNAVAKENVKEKLAQLLAAVRTEQAEDVQKLITELSIDSAEVALELFEIILAIPCKETNLNKFIKLRSNNGDKILECILMKMSQAVGDEGFVPLDVSSAGSDFLQTVIKAERFDLIEPLLNKCIKFNVQYVYFQLLNLEPKGCKEPLRCKRVIFELFLRNEIASKLILDQIKDSHLSKLLFVVGIKQADLREKLLARMKKSSNYFTFISGFLNKIHQLPEGSLKVQETLDSFRLYLSVLTFNGDIDNFLNTLPEVPFVSADKALVFYIPILEYIEDNESLQGFKDREAIEKIYNLSWVVPFIDQIDASSIDQIDASSPGTLDRAYDNLRRILEELPIQFFPKFKEALKARNIQSDVRVGINQMLEEIEKQNQE